MSVATSGFSLITFKRYLNLFLAIPIAFSTITLTLLTYLLNTSYLGVIIPLIGLA